MPSAAPTRKRIPLRPRSSGYSYFSHSDLEKHFIRAETIRWISCWKRAPKRMPAPKPRCVAKARTTLRKMATICTLGTVGSYEISIAADREP